MPLTPEQRAALVEVGRHIKAAHALLGKHQYAMASGEQYPILQGLNSLGMRVDAWLTQEGASAQELQAMETTR